VFFIEQGVFLLLNTVGSDADMKAQTSVG